VIGRSSDAGWDEDIDQRLAERALFEGQARIGFLEGLTMAMHLIGYALPRASERIDAGLIQAIKNIGSEWWHGFESTWLVSTTKTTDQIRDELAPHLSPEGRLIVVACGSAAAWSGFGDTQAYWLAQSF
jgi:hypothetical protein